MMGFRVFLKKILKVISSTWSSMILRSFLANLSIKFTVKMDPQTPPDAKPHFSWISWAVFSQQQESTKTGTGYWRFSVHTMWFPLESRLLLRNTRNWRRHSVRNILSVWLDFESILLQNAFEVKFLFEAWCSMILAWKTICVTFGNKLWMAPCREKKTNLSDDYFNSFYGGFMMDSDTRVGFWAMKLKQAFSNFIFLNSAVNNTMSKWKFWAVLFSKNTVSTYMSKYQIGCIIQYNAEYQCSEVQCSTIK